MNQKKTNTNREPQSPERHVRRSNFLREIFGIALGVGAGLMIGSILPQIRETTSMGSVMLWSGAAGGFLASLDRFEQAGAALTRSENRLKNYLVGVGIPLAILLLFLFAR